MAQGAGRARASQHCHDGGAAWLLMALPRLRTSDCRPLAARAHKGRVAIAARCGPGGRLTITGTADRDSFDLIARRTGPVGGNPATVTMLSQGRRTASRCPLSGGG